MNQQNEDINDYKAQLWGSLLLFTKTFYKLRTGREFEISKPTSQESHFIRIFRALTDVINGKTKRLIIQIPPRYGKTEIAIHFVAWAMSMFPDSNFLYVSYGATLAKKQTQTIRQIINLPHYRKYFGVSLSDESSAKDNFETVQGGSIYAAGSQGTITGRGAGITGLNRFGGCIFIDDIHKPEEITSDTIRSGTNEWYYNTLQSRVNNPESTPIIVIGQSLHEDDLLMNLRKTGDWETLILPALDVNLNALYPEKHTRSALLRMKELNPYVFSAQYMQDPLPAGGGIFKEDNFLTLDFEPKILKTFMTIDTAETSKTYNDPTVMSFFGIYKIAHHDVETDLFGLHWIDCIEIWVEPKDLESEFMQFYASCMRHRVKPGVCGIEKKSTGVTLLSTLKGMQGLNIIDIPRDKSSGSKSDRFLQIQPYVAEKRITLPSYGKHTKMCIEHCKKITANNSHRFDDIADTLYDGVKMALIDQVILRADASNLKQDEVVKNISSHFNQLQRSRAAAAWR